MVVTVASLVGNLGPLAYFKYGEFMLENFVFSVKPGWF